MQYTERIEKQLKVWEKTPDWEFIYKFYRALRLENIRERRILKYFYNLKQFRRLIDKSLFEMNQDDLEDLLLKIQELSVSENTKRTKRKLLKKFIRFLKKTFNRDIDETVIKTENISSTISSEQLITNEEFNKMFATSPSTQDKAMLGLLYETGIRIGELLNLKVGSVLIEGNTPYLKLAVEGKTGKRIVLLNWYKLPLVDHLESHPLREDINAPLFYIRERLTGRILPMSGAAVRKRIKTIAKRVNITKRIYPHLFRHTRMTKLATDNVNESVMKSYAGWSRTSKMPANYVHLSQKDTELSIASAVYGISSSKNEEKTIRCPICREENMFHATYCIKCRSPLDQKVLLETQKQEELYKRLDLVMFRFLSKIVEKDPELKQEFIEMSKNEGLADLL